MAMPERIKRNLITRKIYDLVHNKKLNATLICIGRPGMGKSVTMQEMLYTLDPTFNLNRIVFNLDSFLQLLDEGDPLTGKLKPGQAVLFDEVVTDEGAESRGAMSKSNKLMTYIAANFRARRLIVGMCLPSLMQLDKNLREVNVTGIIEIVDKSNEKRKNKCKIFWCRYDPYTQYAIRQYPRVINDKGHVYKVRHVWLPIPSKETIDQYEVKKMDYLARNIARWHAMVKKENDKKDFNMNDIIQKVKSDPEKYMDNGRYNSGFIKIQENIGRINAEIIAKFLNHEIEKKKIKLPKVIDMTPEIAQQIRDLK